MDIDNWQEMEEWEWEEWDSWCWQDDMPIPVSQAWWVDLTAQV